MRARKKEVIQGLNLTRPITFHVFPALCKLFPWSLCRMDEWNKGNLPAVEPASCLNPWWTVKKRLYVMFLLWPLFTVVKGGEAKICSGGDGSHVWVVVRQRGRILFWEDWGMTVFFQVDVHAPPSAQTESSASVLRNTQCRRTAQAAINWEEVFLADQLGCCCCSLTTQPAGRRTSSCLCLWALVGVAQRVYFLLLTYTIWAAGERNQRSAAPPADNSVIGIYIWLRTLFTLSGARRPSTRNVIFTSRDAERCQLLSPSPVYFYLFIFLSAAHLFHETPLRRRESWRRTRRLSSHDQLKKKTTKKRGETAGLFQPISPTT